MKQKEINSICVFMSLTALIIVLFLYFEKSREGLKPSMGVSVGKKWKFKEVEANKDQIHKALKQGKKIDTKSLPKNLAILYRGGSKWVTKFILHHDGTLESKGKKKGKK